MTVIITPSTMEMKTTSPVCLPTSLAGTQIILFHSFFTPLQKLSFPALLFALAAGLAFEFCSFSAIVFTSVITLSLYAGYACGRICNIFSSPSAPDALSYPSWCCSCDVCTLYTLMLSLYARFTPPMIIVSCRGSSPEPTAK